MPVGEQRRECPRGTKVKNQRLWIIKNERLRIKNERLRIKNERLNNNAESQSQHGDRATRETSGRVETEVTGKFEIRARVKNAIEGKLEA